MQITWLTAGGISFVDGQPYSDLASERYRVLMPARALEAHGVRVLVVPVGCPPDDPIWKSALRSQVLVVAKMFERTALDVIARFRAASCRVVVDVCDDHFETPQVGELYTQFCQRADAITVSTAAMGEAIALRLGRHATVIDDPFEAPAGEPRFAPGPIACTWPGLAAPSISTPARR